MALDLTTAIVSDPAGRVLAPALRASEAAVAARSLVYVLASTNHPCCRHARRHRTLLGDSSTSWSAKAEHRRSEGELAIGRGSSRHNLVFGRSRGSLTMMQSCASAAKLRGGGPILRNGVNTMACFG